MKTINLIITAFNFLLIIGACSITSHKSEIFDSNKLKGRYSIIFNADKLTKDSTTNEGEQIGSGILMLIFSATNLEVNFYEKDKGIYSYSIGAFVNSVKFEYRLENDSIFSVRVEGDKEWSNKIILRKFNSSYDYIELISFNKDNIPFTLKKISE